jgi:hypothetical protein
MSCHCGRWQWAGRRLDSSGQTTGKTRCFDLRCKPNTLAGCGHCKHKRTGGVIVVRSALLGHVVSQLAVPPANEIRSRCHVSVVHSEVVEIQGGIEGKFCRQEVRFSSFLIRSF